MSVKRCDLVRYLEENGYHLLREGGNHSIYYNGKKSYFGKKDIINLTE